MNTLKRYLLLILITIAIFLQFFYFQNKTADLQRQINATHTRISDASDLFDSSMTSLREFRDESQELDETTLEGLIGTMDYLESVVLVYDENVDIYNENDANHSNRLYELEQSVEAIVDYLTNF